MQNAYERQTIKAILDTNYNIIMVYRSKLINSQINFIGMMAAEYNKKIIFGSMKEMLFNESNNEKILVIR